MDASSGPAVVWFRRDLRLHDHPALTLATADGRPVVPLVVLDPRLLRGRFASPNRTWFLLGSIAALAADLSAFGAPLVIRVGDPRRVVPDIVREATASAVYVSRDHAPYGLARDAAVRDILAAVGVDLHEAPGLLIHEPEAVATRAGGPFRLYSPFRRAWSALGRRPVLPPPARLIGHDLDPGVLPTLADLDVGDGPTADIDALPHAGEPAARERLDRWLAAGIDGYAESRDRVDLLGGTSRLSADLHLGTLSPLEVVVRADGQGQGRQRFIDELIWREFYAHVLSHDPGVRTRAFHPAFDRVAWSSDAAAIDAWRDGRTGYPFVDAAMRQLRATGWMPNRARMVVASFLTKDLLVDWRVGEAHFMRHLVDGDVASNNGGWQWSAGTGTDPQPWFRIFNPVAQGRRADPDGVYIRRWVPELSRVPTAHLHAPWELSVADLAAAGVRIGRDYPARVVEHADARARALTAYDAARRTS